MFSIDEFINLFPDIKQRKPNQWMAKCPSHNDGNKSDHWSLSITGLPDKVLVKCMAGCPIETVLSALKINKSDLFFKDRKPSKSTSSKLREIDITYDYHDANGSLLFQVVRWKPKGFSQRQPVRLKDGTIKKNTWIWELEGITPVIYQLPRVVKAIREGETILLPEGEKDADNITKHLKMVATTSPMGAGKWRDTYTSYFVGAKGVVVIADNDIPGKLHAKTIADNLFALNIPVKILDMPEKFSDISDWISGGLTKDELKKIISGLPPYETPPEPIGAKAFEKFRRTDLGNAERLVHQYGENIHYCYQRKQWLIWNEKCWQWDLGGRITGLAQKTVRSIYKEAADEDDDDERKALASHAKSSESNSRIKAMIEQAESMVAVDIKDLDSHSWKLNCLNGTIELKTGELLPHSRNNLITMTVPVEFHPDAQSGLWDNFLNRVCDHKEDVISYLQRCMGYTLSGDTREQCLFFCWGTGMNGKSTFLNAFREILAPYAIQADTEMFMAAFKPQHGGHSEDVANLYGKRYVVGSEIEEGRRLAVNKLKQMTGGETVRASHKFEREIEFDVNYKIWLNGNHKPDISDTTYSIWRRVKLIPFNIRIPDVEQDKQLKEKLRAEYPALLAWAVQGCVEWVQYGLSEPEEVTNATTEYRNEQDILGDFFIDKGFIDPQQQVGKAELWQAYQDWSSDNGVNPIGQRTFNRRISERGFLTHRGTAGKKMWRGIRLLETDELSQVTQVTQVSGKDLFSYTREITMNNVENRITKVTSVTDDEPETPKELLQMLLDIEKKSKDEIIEIWESAGRPVIKIGAGPSIPDLKKYLDTGIENMDHLGIIGGWLRDIQKLGEG